MTFPKDLHNETGARIVLDRTHRLPHAVNIHSHLWGAVLFLVLLLTVYPVHIQSYSTVTWADLIVFHTFLLSAVLCLAASAFFHTSTCHSHEVGKITLRAPQVFTFLTDGRALSSV